MLALTVMSLGSCMAWRRCQVLTHLQGPRNELRLELKQHQLGNPRSRVQLDASKSPEASQNLCTGNSIREAEQGDAQFLSQNLFNVSRADRTWHFRRACKSNPVTLFACAAR